MKAKTRIFHKTPDEIWRSVAIVKKAMGNTKVGGKTHLYPKIIRDSSHGALFVEDWGNGSLWLGYETSDGKESHAIRISRDTYQSLVRESKANHIKYRPK